MASQGIFYINKNNKNIIIEDVKITSVRAKSGAVALINNANNNIHFIRI